MSYKDEYNEWLVNSGFPTGNHEILCRKHLAEKKGVKEQDLDLEQHYKEMLEEDKAFKDALERGVSYGVISKVAKPKSGKTPARFEYNVTDEFIDLQNNLIGYCNHSKKKTGEPTMLDDAFYIDNEAGDPVIGQINVLARIVLSFIAKTKIQARRHPNGICNDNCNGIISGTDLQNEEIRILTEEIPENRFGIEIVAVGGAVYNLLRSY